MSDLQQWYMSIGGHQVGPIGTDDMISNIHSGNLQPDTYVFTQGMQNWAQAKEVESFSRYFDKSSLPLPIPTAPGRTAHEIDFKIVGEELQFVEVELDPGESAVAEAGSMMYMTPGIEMETVFGDGSANTSSSGIVEKLMGAGQTIADRRKPVHDDFYQYGHRTSNRSLSPHPMQEESSPWILQTWAVRSSARRIPFSVRRAVCPSESHSSAK